MQVERQKFRHRALFSAPPAGADFTPGLAHLAYRSLVEVHGWSGWWTRPDLNLERGGLLGPAAKGSSEFAALLGQGFGLAPDVRPLDGQFLDGARLSIRF